MLKKNPFYYTLFAFVLGSTPVLSAESTGAIAESAKSDRIYSYKDLTVQPRFRANVEFPLMNSHSKSPLSATIAIVVSEKGQIKDAKLLASSDAEFGEDALDVAKSGEWLLEPGKLNGERVKCITIVKLWGSFEFDDHRHLKLDRRVWLADGMPSNEPPRKFKIRDNAVFKRGA